MTANQEPLSSRLAEALRLAGEATPGNDAQFIVAACNLLLDLAAAYEAQRKVLEAAENEACRGLAAGDTRQALMNIKHALRAALASQPGKLQEKET